MDTDDLNREPLNFSCEHLAECLTIAREASGKTAAECSQLLGISASRLRGYENGKFIPSLPEIEALSYIYSIPLRALFDPQILPKYIHKPDAEQLKQLLLIRQEIIATRLQLACEKSGKNHSEISKSTQIPVSRLKKYGRGDLAIPMTDLTNITKAVGLELDDLLDTGSPLGDWQTTQENAKRFNDLPEEIRSFALSPDNQPYIAFTQRIKELGLENLAHLSESIQQVIDSFHQK